MFKINTCPTVEEGGREEDLHPKGIWEVIADSC